jgi:HSP20 family protein
MALRDLIPWGHSTTAPARRGEAPAFESLHREMNRLFDDFFRDFEVGPWGGRGALQVPTVDVHEDKDAITVSAELPGMEEDDISVELTDNALILSGEKKDEREEERDGYTHTERTYGSFHRAIPLTTPVDGEKVDAKFKNGVLEVKLPKVAGDADGRKRIEVKGS